MESKRNPNVYRFLTLALYFGDACFTPFFSLYFASQPGLSTLEVAVLLALVPFSFFAGNFFYSIFETSWKRNVFLIRLISIIEALSLVALAYSRSFILLLITTILAAFHNSCMFGLIDGMGAGSAKRRNIPFSFIRIMGSLGYITASIFAFFFMDKIGYTWMFTISASIIFLCLPISFLLVPFEGDEEMKRVEVKESKQSANSSFFKNPNLWLFLVFSALFYGGLNNYNYIVPIFMEQSGLTPGQTAIWTVVRVSVEMVIMLLLPVLVKLLKGNKNVLITGCAFGLLALFFTAILSNLDAILWTAFILRGFGYGFGLVSVVLFAEEIVGERDCSKACSLSNGITYCVCGLLNLLSPFIYENIGFQAYFWTIFAIMALGITILFFIKQKRDSSQKSLAKQ